MMKLLGYIKVLTVIILDFLGLMTLFKDPAVVGIIMAIIILYSWFGGYLSLFGNGAVCIDKLPTYECQILKTAKEQLVHDVRGANGVNISGLKLYLIPGDGDLQATAYGANCVSVSRGILDMNNIDPISLNGILAHEVRHLLNLDPEFSRAVFATITLIMIALSITSFVVVFIIFLVFLLLNCFRSYVGIFAFHGITAFIRKFVGLLQKAVVMVYQIVLSFVSRTAEYRCDMYSASLGYGLQLAYFLGTVPKSNHKRTLTEVLYCSHPPVEKRIYRLEKYIKQKMLTEYK